MPKLSEAIARFRAFASTFEPGRADEMSGFTREDMDVLIETLDAVSADVVAGDPDWIVNLRTAE